MADNKLLFYEVSKISENNCEALINKITSLNVDLQRDDLIEDIESCPIIQKTIENEHLGTL